MCRLALLSYHGCPLARLGEKDTGGMNVYVLQVARELAARGHPVDVYTRRHDPRDPCVVHLAPNARVVHLRAGPYGEPKENLHAYIPEFLQNLSQFQQNEGLRYDLVHSHYWLSGEVGRVLSEEWGVPHVATFHTLARTKLRARSGEREPRLRSATEKRVMDLCDAVVATSTAERDDLWRLYGVPGEKVCVIPAGVDLELFAPMPKAEARAALGLENRPTILYVGRIEPLKGLDILVRALALMEDEGRTRLLVVGGSARKDRHVERLRCLARRLGVAERVTFTGPLPQRTLPAYYNAADVFVLPSHYESFGLVALEAMACGTPVVASRVGGLPTFISDGRDGYLVPWRCPEPFAQRLDMLIANDSLREAMGKAARARAERMGWGVVAEGLADLYTSLSHRVVKVSAVGGPT